jgi:hypothetical protein
VTVNALMPKRVRAHDLAFAHVFRRLWRALYECLYPTQLAKPESLLSASRLWSVVQVQLSCLTPEEQVIHIMNVGDGVYVSAAALVQLAAGASIAPGSVL